MSFDKMSTDEKIKKPFITPISTPQPHFIPGYTGFCPELRTAVGASYARVTNEILKKNPQIACRLKSVDQKVAPPEKRQELEEVQMKKDKRLINSRFPVEGRRVYNDYVMPGYAGHVPNSTDAVGVSFSSGYVQGMSKFIRERAKENGESL